PQELAFDEYNNLFTCDNNSDSGDLARWLHIVEGADYGWRMAFQYFGDRGPFNREKLWETRNSTQPAYVMPAVQNMSDGPAGLSYYPGSGLSENYNGNFFLCDFRGQAGVSGIRTFKVKPKGASFEVIDPEVFLWNCLATDVDFGPDGSVYVSDWVQGWEGTGKGRIYRLYDEKKINSKISKEVKRLLASDFTKLKEKELAALLSHVDRRIRRESQFELARRGKVNVLATVLDKSKVLFTKLHCIWGLGQIGRTDGSNAKTAMESVESVMQDVEPEIRYAAVTALGDARYAPAAKKVFKRLYDKSPRVRLAAAIATSRYQTEAATEDIVEMIRDNADVDVTLRHAGSLALAKCASRAQFAKLMNDESDDVRMATVLAMRINKSESLTEFLNDENEKIATEAALAIHDVPVQKAFPELAKLINGKRFDDAMMRRVLSTHFHLGTPENADQLARFAAERDDAPLPLRQFALKLLSDWGADNQRDPVLGMWRPWKRSRQSLDAIAAIRKNLTKLMTANHEIRGRSARLAAQFGITEVESQLKELLWKRDATGKERAGALLALATLEPDGLEDICGKAIRDNQPRVRAAGRIVLSQTNPDAAVEAVRDALRSGTQLEKQSAVTLLPNI
ncbi:MAG: HEAT repeat domain-containing protein, partial [Planctomycetota bacterium]